MIFYTFYSFLLHHSTFLRRQTFEGLQEWVNDLQKYGAPELVVTLVGNKCDRTDRQVPREEGEQFAKGCPF